MTGIVAYWDVWVILKLATCVGVVGVVNCLTFIIHGTGVVYYKFLCRLFYFFKFFLLCFVSSSLVFVMLFHLHCISFRRTIASFLVGTTRTTPFRMSFVHFCILRSLFTFVRIFEVVFVTYIMLRMKITVVFAFSNWWQVLVLRIWFRSCDHHCEDHKSLFTYNYEESSSSFMSIFSDIVAKSGQLSWPVLPTL